MLKREERARAWVDQAPPSTWCVGDTAERRPLALPQVLYALCETTCTLVYNVLVFVVLPVFVLALISQWRRMRTTVAFFHPYCNAGGGGERVLWYMLRAFIDSKYVGDVLCRW